MKKRLFSTKGFTLIELMIFIAVFSVIITILMQIYTAIVDKQVEVQQFSGVDTDRTYILSRLSYDILRATSISTPGAVGGTSSSLSITIDGSSYVYAVNQNRFTLTLGGSTEYLSSFRSEISNLIFSRLGNENGNNAINISFTISSTLVDQRPEEYTVNTSISTR